MDRTFSPSEFAERSFFKKYRKALWIPFIAALKTYRLIEAGDRIAVCISGGKDSMLLALLLRALQKHSDVPFSLRYLAMDPGYAPENRKKLEENAAHLEVPLEIFETNIFTVTGRTEKNPCYLCARMRRGFLYRHAQDLGCNKIALGHHMDDAVETVLLSTFYSSQLQGMPPKLKSRHFPGMELIRPLYCIREDAIRAWARYNGLTFLNCACAMEQRADASSKRQEIKRLLSELSKQNPQIVENIFRSTHAANLNTLPGWKQDGVLHSFLELFDNALSTE